MTQSLSVSVAASSAGARNDVLDVFGGRQTEGELLLRSHDRALTSGGGVVLLTGPRGVGKGALLTGLKQSLLRAGKGPVFTGSSVGQHRPYAPLADALRDALTHLDGMGLGHEVRARHQAALAVIDAQLLTRPDGAAPASSRLGFHEATLALVRDVLTRTGATLVLSDLEDGEEDTRALCRYLGLHLSDERARPRGVLVLGVTDGAAPEMVAELSNAPSVERVTVGGLDREGLLRFLRNSAAVDRLLSASGGRPGDVDELLSALPVDLGTLLNSRLEKLGEKARAVAQALAVCEAPMGVDSLSAMTAQPAPALAPALQALCEDGLASRRVSNGALMFALVRPAHAQRLRASLSDATRAQLHRLLAQHLEAKGAGLMEGGDQHLAEHFLAAGDAVSGVAYALSASERLTVTHAYGAAIELLTRALPLAVRVEDRQAILSRRAELHQLRGELTAALRDAGRAKALFPSTARGPSYRRLGELLTETGRPRLAVRQLERAQSLLACNGESSVEEGHALAALADALYVSGDRDGARARANAALARNGLPEPLRVRVRNTLGKLALATEDWAGAQQCFQDNRDTALRLGLSQEVARAEINLGVMSFRRGQYEQAELHLGRALKLAEENADLPNQAFCVLNLGSLKHQRRDLASALKLHHESLALFTKIGNRAEMARARLNVANLCLVLGDHAPAQDHLARARELLSQSGLSTQAAYLAALEGDLCLARTEPADALRSYEAARQLYVQMGQRGRAAEQRLRCAQSALRARDLTTAEAALSHLSAERGDLDHPRLRVEAALAQARLLILLGDNGTEATQRVQALLEDARANMPTPPDPEAAALLSFVEGELWLSRGDERRSDKLSAQARDHLHKVASELPPNLRDGYIRSRCAVLGPVATVSRPRLELPESPVAAPEAAPAEVPGARSDLWNQRYAAMVGDSPQLLKVFARLDRLQGSSSTVLIRGESGTGKELVANAIHNLSPRAHGPFIKVNCAALVETLLLSELFGHEKGAFTGAHARKVGRFELARGGTIFLDEIGDISAKTQVSLLRVLQERMFERVGGGTPIKTDCRVIFATNRNLEAMVKAGTFREDLYYRLKGVVVETPALRERRPDIPMLVAHVAHLAATEMGRNAPRFSPQSMDVLTRYDWPGNIRELENAVRSIVLFAEGDLVGTEHLAEFKEFAGRSSHRASTHTPRQDSPDAAGPPGQTNAVPLGQMKKQLEFEAISKALEEAVGNISRAAEILQMKRPRLSQIVNGNPQLRAIKDRFRAEDGGAV